MSRVGAWFQAIWAHHPWLAGFEALIALVAVLELVLFAHMLAGWGWGLLSHNPDAFDSTRFVFMTGSDAQFGAAMIALLGLLPAGLLLFLVGGAGWLWARASAAPSADFVTAFVGGMGLMVLSALFCLTNKVWGGGILPH